ncbi:MAG: long-chain fatty acid transport protein [Pseudomonadota bacterium]|jgi:long-chain fatty acid transport protein
MTARLIRPLLQPVAAAALLACAGNATATNGMNMEGYGPISTGMGGASQAIDHGTAAMAQNPATLGLMGTDMRLDVAIGQLGPKVKSSAGPAVADSGGTSYVMPAVGFVRRDHKLTWGVGVFAQGGMGTEYTADSFMALNSGQPVRSELGVGRFIIPLAWQASNDLTIGATLDYVWATLDLRLAATGAQLGGMVTGASGNLGAALPALGGAPWARVDFSDNSDFSGSAKGNGWAGKLGFVWKATPDFTLGASYQAKTSLSDMKTSSTSASLTAAGGFADSGKLTVEDFQWPAMTAIGAAWQVAPGVLLAADVKHIGWADVMQSFKMRYDSAGMGGSVSFKMPQNWKDQTVTNLGVAWSANSQLTVRVGANLSDNPIPQAFVNPLFPATVKSHYTMGLGYAISPQHDVNFSYTMAPEVSVTNADSVVVSHKQSNLQLMYTARF